VSRGVRECPDTTTRHTPSRVTHDPARASWAGSCRYADLVPTTERLSPQDWAGRSYPPTPPYSVTVAAAAEFAGVLGLPTDQVPPTLPIVVVNEAWQALFDDPALDLQLQRIVHGEQRFSWNRPVRVGDELVGAATIDRVVERGGVEMIHASVALTTAAGEPVGTASATLVHTREVAPA